MWQRAVVCLAVSYDRANGMDASITRVCIKHLGAPARLAIARCEREEQAALVYILRTMPARDGRLDMTASYSKRVPGDVVPSEYACNQPQSTQPRMRAFFILEASIFLIFLALAWRSDSYPQGSLSELWLGLYSACAFIVGTVLATVVGIVALLRIRRGSYRWRELPWEIMCAISLPPASLVVALFLIPLFSGH